GTTTLTLEQGEYTLDRPSKTPLTWHVPVTVRDGAGNTQRLLVNHTAQLNLPGCDAPVLVNAGQKGYYRTLYTPAQFKALAARLPTLPVADQLGVLLDTAALATVGLQPDADLLDLTASLPADAAPDLWRTVSRTFVDLDDLFDSAAADRTAWRAYALARLAPVFARYGWDERDGDSAQVKQLRAQLIKSLGSLDDPAVIAEAQRRFIAFQANPASVSPELRSTVLSIVARHADAATWQALQAMAKKETSAMVRDEDYLYLAQAKDPALAERALALALTSEPGATNAASMIRAVAKQHPELAFDFAVAHRNQVNALVDTTSRARYYPGLADGSFDLKTVDKIKAFADKYIAPTSRREAETAISAIQTRVKLRDQRVPQIRAWLQARKA
ncbi:ERAP1-like C-terminal domain-containing protein, partial [Xanthomonas vesicatoria]